MMKRGEEDYGRKGLWVGRRAVGGGGDGGGRVRIDLQSCAEAAQGAGKRAARRVFFGECVSRAPVRRYAIRLAWE